jgi:hypothetical protein
MPEADQVGLLEGGEGNDALGCEGGGAERKSDEERCQQPFIGLRSLAGEGKGGEEGPAGQQSDVVWGGRGPVGGSNTQKRWSGQCRPAHVRCEWHEQERR